MSSLTFLKNAHPLERLIESGLQTPFIERALEKLVQEQIAYEEAEMKRLRPRLAAYETRYGMSSEEFFSRYQAGELGDSMDFFEWNVLYKMFLDTQRRLKILRGEQ